MRVAAATLITMLLAGCSSEKPVPKAVQRAAAEAPKITQFYASKPSIGRGEKTLLCYGVENAKTVTLSPPRQELSAALSRCIDVEPAESTTYVLTAEGEGPAATGNVTVTVGAPHVRIVEVQVSELQVLRGDAVSLCYQVENAKSVRVDPVHFQGGAKNKGCVVVNPIETTKYVVTATGESGDTDKQEVTVKVK